MPKEDITETVYSKVGGATNHKQTPTKQTQVRTLHFSNASPRPGGVREVTGEVRASVRGG